MKNNIRISILGKRDSLDMQTITSVSNDVYDNLFNLINYDDYNTYFIYLDFKNEVKTNRIINFLLDNGKRVLVPLTNSKDVSMKAVEIKSFDDLSVGNFGVLEPNDIDNDNDIVPEVVIVPGVAFDINGNRIGFGKGYYDNYFNSLVSIPIKIALAYDFQVLDSIPSEKHDVKMNYIVTGKKVITI